MHYSNVFEFVNTFCKNSFTMFSKMPAAKYIQVTKESVGRGLAPAAFHFVRERLDSPAQSTL